MRVYFDVLEVRILVYFFWWGDIVRFVILFKKILGRSEEILVE